MPAFAMLRRTGTLSNPLRQACPLFAVRQINNPRGIEMVKYYLFLLLPLLFISCNERSATNCSGDSIESLKSLIPAKVGIYWVYADTTYWSNNTVKVSVDTTFIVGVDKMYGEYWFEIRGNSYATSVLRDRFMVRGDSVFNLQYFMNRATAGLMFIPPTGDTIQYIMTIGGDAGVIYYAVFQNEIISTPFGSFQGYGKYFNNRPPPRKRNNQNCSRDWYRRKDSRRWNIFRGETLHT